MPFVEPGRLIKDLSDMRKFESSRTSARFLSFIHALNSAVCGVKLSDECFVSPLVKRLVDALATAEEWMNEYPPSQEQMRYGNTAFRSWHQHLIASSKGGYS
mmetsp:Transcript_29801/g.73842  ORF Transcript_29801/g.73842 Transcript_29801/m.73842 type:complete len:102 (-) Transcript_29801:4772-5077(-)